MPLLDNNNNPTLLLSIIKVTATIFLFFFFLLPFALFSLIFNLIYFFLFLPIFFASGLALIFYRIVFRCPVRCLSFILASFKSHSNIEGRLENNKQESIDLDDSELPSLDELEQEEDENRVLTEYRWYTVIVEHKPFEEIMSFWRRKERGEVS